MNGIAVLGPAFTLGGGRVEGDDRRHLTHLPAMAAAAWYHGRLAPEVDSVEAAMAAAQAFARDDYLKALDAGHLLAAPEREHIAARLAELTGVPAPAWVQSSLRLGPAAFQNLLLQARGLQLGAYDLRYTLPAQPTGGDPVVDDPAMGQYTPGFVAAFHEYLAKELGVAFAEPYLPIVWDRVNFKWNYGAGLGVTLPRNDATALAVAMRRNPALQVFVAAGYYDLVTPLAAAEYALAHAPIPRERLTLKGYPSGHMSYMGEASARALAADLRAFVRGAVRPSAGP
ncbi:MAG: hypothetical protein PHW25_16485 [Zoogloea sp.]|uniref:hypothetical protein n=1 Tax=Zoogloea sp. TaxID=49181 RepID=UPI002634FAA5|nr:hypothetical protein [Zoogloea sp.]MDD3328682.1 hypothetical protein [Zoogloea sp.]